MLPITHVPPADMTAAVEIPAAVKRRLGLDDDRSWIVLLEANAFTWPGPDLRPVPGDVTGSVAYGLLPPGLFACARSMFIAAVESRRAATVRRTQ